VNARTALKPVAKNRTEIVARGGTSVSATVGYWDRRLGFLMHDVSRLRRTVFDRYVAPMGVTRSQWWVLSYLARNDGMTQSDLAGALELGKAALGSMIDRLEAQQLVRRADDATDRRVKRVHLSSKGQALHVMLLPVSEEMSERFIRGLDDVERHALVELLERVKLNLQRCLAAPVRRGSD